MPELLKKLTIENYRGFYSPQEVQFALPNGNVGSGLTIILGQNNSGKSTILEAIKKFREGSQFERTDRHLNKSVTISMENSSGNKKVLTTSGGALSAIDQPRLQPAVDKFYLITSRRYWETFFHPSEVSKSEYKNNVINITKTGSDGQFGRKMIEIEKELSLKNSFNLLMKRLVPHFSDWHIELDRGQNYINYKTKGGAEHNSELFGMEL